jgi:hypothetical protein
MALNQVGLERLNTATTKKIGVNKNIIINGAMQVAQRGTSEASVSTTKYANAPDRWRFVAGNGGTWTVSQSTTSPNLFKNSYKFDCTTADSSLGAGDFLAFDQGLEGLDLQGLGWGTSDAKSITVSFHVRSNKTGTYTCELFQGAGGVGGSNILVSKSYTISAADTWEKKTITFSGNTAVAFTNDNSRQLTLNLWLAAGSNFTGGTFSDGTYHNANNKRVASGQVNLADSTSNEWYITGVQIEVGTVATDFEHRSFGQELALCQRYYYRWTADAIDAYAWMGMSYSTTTCFGIVQKLPVTMRATPTSSVVGTYTPFGSDGSSAGHADFSSTTMNKNNKDQLGTNGWGGANGIQEGGRPVVVRANAATDYIDASAEL